ncbi:amidase family protein [Levilactobacillus namurensis]|uniref:amidase family protein n=1 Tax=Levilactobacillus namurensis TaxID=380393 RepID=UPI0026ED6F1D|nr:amidase family protein [Levilactobacillus namurensis]
MVKRSWQTDRGGRLSGLSRWFLLLVTVVTLGSVSVSAHATPVTAESVTAGQLQKAVGVDGAVATPVTQASGISAQVYRTSSALDLAQQVRSGKVTSTQLVQQAIAKVKADNPQLNGVITLREDAALQEAAALKDTGQPFLGVPILIKGLGQTIKGGQNTDGLYPNRNAISGYTGILVRNLQSAGFIVIGQTNFPEMGLLNVTTSKLYGAAHSAWNTAYQPGGSSGGSATSVADGMVPIATGNDAGGSVRIPAAWSGLVGLKPTQGMIQGDGSSATAHTVNFAETKTMADTQQLFDALKQSRASAPAAPSQLNKLTIAYTTKSPVGTPVSADAVKAVQQAVSFLKQQGFTVKEVNPPVDGKALMRAYYILDTSAGSVANYVIQTATKKAMTKDDVSPLTWGLYQASKNLTKEQVAQANATIADGAAKMATFHQTYPLLLTPTVATTAPLVSDPAVLPQYEAKLKNMENVPVDQQMPLIYDAWLHGLSMTPFTQQANLTGEPAISLPTYVSAKGLPLGIQFTAAKNQDRTLMAMGALFEQHHLFKTLADTQATPEPSPSTGTGSSTGIPSQPQVTEPSVTPTAPVVRPTAPNQQTAKPAKKIVKVVYVTSPFKLYRDAAQHQVKRQYKAHSRTTAPSFKVLQVIKTATGQRVYRVKGGYLLAGHGVYNRYYQRVPQKPKRAIRVIAKKGVYEYRTVHLKRQQRIKHVKVKKILHVKKIVKVGHVTRYQLKNGHYVTANRQFVHWN